MTNSSAASSPPHAASLIGAALAVGNVRPDGSVRDVVELGDGAVIFVLVAPAIPSLIVTQLAATPFPSRAYPVRCPVAPARRSRSRPLAPAPRAQRS